MAEKAIMESVMEARRRIDEHYYPKISPLEEELEKIKKWLDGIPPIVNIPPMELNKAKNRATLLEVEVKRLKEEQKEKLLKIHQDNKLVSSSLRKLNALRGANFKKRSKSSGLLLISDSTVWAYSKKTEEEAYYCDKCKLWIVGDPHLRSLGKSVFSPSDTYFCVICDNIVGHYHTHHDRRGP